MVADDGKTNKLEERHLPYETAGLEQLRDIGILVAPDDNDESSHESRCLLYSLCGPRKWKLDVIKMSFSLLPSITYLIISFYL